MPWLLSGDEAPPSLDEVNGLEHHKRDMLGCECECHGSLTRPDGRTVRAYTSVRIFWIPTAAAWPLPLCSQRMPSLPFLSYHPSNSSSSSLMKFQLSISAFLSFQCQVALPGLRTMHILCLRGQGLLASTSTGATYIPPVKLMISLPVLFG